MNLLLDVLRKAEEGRHPPDTAPQQAFPQRPMALEPIDAAPHLAPVAAREQIERILAWEADRLVLAHGDVVERGATRLVHRAYRWL